MTDKQYIKLLIKVNLEAQNKLKAQLRDLRVDKRELEQELKICYKKSGIKSTASVGGCGGNSPPNAVDNLL